MANHSNLDAKNRYWQQQIETWQRSGQSQRAFCLAHDLDYYRFGYWKKKCTQPNPGQPASVAQAFVPVVSAVRTSRNELSLTLPNGAVIEGIEADNVAIVCQLLAGVS